MVSSNKFKSGEAVSYKDGMDFKDFNGIVEKCIEYKGGWHYMVKDVKDKSIKRVGERNLRLTSEDQAAPSKSKFKIGDQVKYKNDRDFQVFNGIVERSINNYQGQWQYMVKDAQVNVIKRVDEKNLEYNLTSSISLK